MTTQIFPLKKNPNRIPATPTHRAPHAAVSAPALILTFAVPSYTIVNVELPLYTANNVLCATLAVGSVTVKSTTTTLFNGPSFFLDNSLGTKLTTFTVTVLPPSSVITTFGLPSEVQADVFFGNSGPTNSRPYGWPGVQHLTSVIQWGTILTASITSLRAAFWYANQLTNVPNKLPTNVTNLSHLFQWAVKFNSKNVTKWNTSQVTNMSNLFSYASIFNQSLNAWNVSNVTNMSRMFEGNVYNLSLNKWNTSNVTNMSYMFSSNVTFNQPLNSFNVSNVTNMSYMFSYAYKFNQPLNTWNVSKVLNFSYMFAETVSFNQNLSAWNFATTGLTPETSFFAMFQNAASFNDANYALIAINWPSKLTESSGYVIEFSESNLLSEKLMTLTQYNTYKSKFTDSTVFNYFGQAVESVPYSNVADPSGYGIFTPLTSTSRMFYLTDTANKDDDISVSDSSGIVSSLYVFDPINKSLLFKADPNPTTYADGYIKITNNTKAFASSNSSEFYLNLNVPSSG